jgi:hypothetical protein
MNSINTGKLGPRVYLALALVGVRMPLWTCKASTVWIEYYMKIFPERISPTAWKIWEVFSDCTHHATFYTPCLPETLLSGSLRISTFRSRLYLPSASLSSFYHLHLWQRLPNHLFSSFLNILVLIFTALQRSMFFTLTPAFHGLTCCGMMHNAFHPVGLILTALSLQLFLLGWHGWQAFPLFPVAMTGKEANIVTGRHSQGMKSRQLSLPALLVFSRS